MNRFSGFDGFDRSDDFSDVVKKFSKKRKKGFWITLTVIVLAVVALVSSYDLIMEYWQIQEIGENYTSVFWINLWARVLTQGIGFLLVFLVLWLNLSLLKRFALVKAFDFSVEVCDDICKNKAELDCALAVLKSLDMTAFKFAA